MEACVGDAKMVEQRPASQTRCEIGQMKDRTRPRDGDDSEPPDMVGQLELECVLGVELGA